MRIEIIAWLKMGVEYFDFNNVAEYEVAISGFAARLGKPDGLPAHEYNLIFGRRANPVRTNRTGERFPLKE